jgi:hypothetical protein
VTTSWVAPAADVRRSRAWVLIVVLLGAVVFGWTNAPEAEAGLPPTSISLEKTVGLDPDICAVDDEITVGPGTDVTYCYYVTNTGLSDLTSHDLTDGELGDILTDFPYILAPGASAYTTLGATIDDTTTNTATWTATNPDIGASATGTDSATVNVPVPSITLAKTVGLDPDVCAVDDEITVGPGTDIS